MDKEGYLTIKDLMNFHYCKRLIYFENVLKIRQATTIKEFKGREVHSIFSKKSKRNKIIKEFPKLQKDYNKSLCSKELNFRTVLDCLMIDKEKNEAFPLEYKNTKKPAKIYWTLKIQMFAESLLIREVLGCVVPYAFIKFKQSNELVKIQINKNCLKAVKETIKGIDKIIKTELLPTPTKFEKRCKDCCYWKICQRI